MTPVSPPVAPPVSRLGSATSLRTIRLFRALRVLRLFRRLNEVRKIIEASLSFFSPPPLSPLPGPSL